MVLPAITYNSKDLSNQYGLRQIFWFGRSDCYLLEGDFRCNYGNWITEDGWEEMLRHFVTASRADEGEENAKEVLWMYIPDFKMGGKLNSIVNVTNSHTVMPEWWK